jgi:hypothetical protein
MLALPDRLPSQSGRIKPSTNRLLIDPYPGRRILHRHRLFVILEPTTGDPLTHASPLQDRHSLASALIVSVNTRTADPNMPIRPNLTKLPLIVAHWPT